MNTNTRHKLASPAALRLEPPLDPPRDCSEDGHQWRHAGTARDGTTFNRCAVCGIWTDP